MSLVDVFNLMWAWLCWLVGVRTQRPADIGRGKKVVIVGAGFAGVTLAHYLEASTGYDVVLFDKKEYFEFTPSMLRVLVKPSHMAGTHTKYEDMPLLDSPRITLRQEEVDAITDAAVRTKSGEWVKYDKLVLAMGSDYVDSIKPNVGGLTLSSRVSQVASVHSRIADAPSVQVFGAGLVGVELAAEIAEVWPDKKVVLRTRGKEVLPGFPAKAQKKALAWFSKHGTQIIFDNAISPARYTPNKDELVFDCTGVKPVTMDAMFHRNNDATPTATVANGKTRSRTKAAASTPTGPSSAGRPLAWSSQVDARTQLLRITPEMHLVGHENIFAIGDVMVEDALRTLSPQARAAKVAYQAELQAWVVSENLKRQSESRPEWRFPIDVAAVDSSPTLIACSFGAYDGAVIFNDIVITGYFAAFSKDVLEATKRWFLRGWFVGELVWFIIDPMTLFVHRLYVAVTKKSKK